MCTYINKNKSPVPATVAQTYTFSTQEHEAEIPGVQGQPELLEYYLNEPRQRQLTAKSASVN